jgi:hypothetical protein
VKEAVSVSMALDADKEKAIDNPRPYDHRMMGIGSDYIGVAAHGWAHTHIDSLAHVNYDGCSITGTSLILPSSKSKAVTPRTPLSR